MSDLTPQAPSAGLARLAAAHAYDPAHEHASCGVGLIASLDGSARREVVTLAIAALKAVWHRGAVDADGRTGDGAGIRVDIPHDFFAQQIAATGHAHDAEHGPIGVGMVFLPRVDIAGQEAARAIVEGELLKVGLYLYGWRQVPVDPRCLGDKAKLNRPEIEQVLFRDPKARGPAAIARALYIARRRIEHRAQNQGLGDLYVCSLSQESVIYKGLFLAAEIDAFYDDLNDPGFVSRAAIFHQRYSTNTFPQWRLAQPFRVLAHNGEINTLKGNANWMTSHEIGFADDAFGKAAADVRPIIQRGASDSAALDQVFEALTHAGRPVPFVKALMLPEAWSRRATPMDPARRALFAYANTLLEPWDGPAAVAACAGEWAIAGLDRNGLRPLRWARTHDGLLAVGSEAGMCPLEPERIVKRGAIRPGGMIGVNLATGTFYDDEALTDYVAGLHPFADWVADQEDLEDTINTGEEPMLFSASERTARLRAMGASREDLAMVIAPMVETGKEGVGSMGDDTPLAVLSDRVRPLAHFFRQNFSQVTNPPIDPLREGGVMSLRTRFHNLRALTRDDGPAPGVLTLESPILSNGALARLLARLENVTTTLDATYPREGALGDGAALRAALRRLADDAQAAVQKDGRAHLVISDLDQTAQRVAIPPILAVAAVHRRLMTHGERRACAITVRAGDVFDAHGAAVLIGVGATCVNPYLAFDAGAAHRGDPGQAAAAIKSALDAGLMKIISKMGIAVISGYRGGCFFETLGLSRALVAEYFPGAPSRISGLGLAGIEASSLERHDEAHAPALPGAERPLPIGGFYTVRKAGEAHAVEARVVYALHKAVRENDQAAFDAYVEALNSQEPIQLRDLLEIRAAETPTPKSKVEAAKSLIRRFITPGMSLGALSPEAHGALNMAMNRLGARSVSGEGGEDPERYLPRADGENANSAIKQIASGRFGVTAEYLNQAEELEIKIAQGAKPGEGGQLPGFKVTDFIARMRHATPGVTLISPPPHHDIYSIEDLAQLIYDLKQVNPDARVTVKLVAQAGIGPVAAGVAKAEADTILISGHVGGTGASPLTSIKFAGSPWELGLSEAHQVLVANGLRDRVRLRTDGGLRTGRDIVIAAMLGAEEFNIGTIALVAMGCLMVRQCHSNTCPVGVCTQDPALRDRFVGLPEHVTRLMRFLAEDVRRHLALVGAKRLDEVVGRTDFLHQVSRGADHLDDLDLNPMLVRVDPTWSPRPRQTRNEPPPNLDVEILAEAGDAIAAGRATELSYTVQNVDRAIGARLSSAIVRAHGPRGMEPGRMSVHLTGSAGQSLGAFGMRGLRLILTGEANDYVGKGLSGAEIFIAPHTPTPEPDAIVGNTCLYGATSGALFAAGRAGERFAVRNSGADAVVEGLSANGCEYMTGGTVVVLGAIGDNFGAGMTGGMAALYDPSGTSTLRINPDSVLIEPLCETDQKETVRALIARHVAATNSLRARAILDSWEQERGRFVCVIPRELAARAAAERETSGSAVA